MRVLRLYLGVCKSYFFVLLGKMTKCLKENSEKGQKDLKKLLRTKKKIYRELGLPYTRDLSPY